MADNPTASRLLGAEIVLRELWDLRVYCRQCLTWRTLRLAALPDAAKAGRVIDVVARLRCQTCGQRPQAVRAEYDPPASRRGTPLHRVELLRGGLPSLAPMPDDGSPPDE